MGAGDKVKTYSRRRLRGDWLNFGQEEGLCHSPASQPASSEALLLPILAPQMEHLMEHSSLPPLPQSLLITEIPAHRSPLPGSLLDPTPQISSSYLKFTQTPSECLLYPQRIGGRLWLQTQEVVTKASASAGGVRAE